jgi:hypothetical protein
MWAVAQELYSVGACTPSCSTALDSVKVTARLVTAHMRMRIRARVVRMPVLYCRVCCIRYR